MNILITLGIALGLSADAFSVAITQTTTAKNMPLRYGLRMALFFGAFQFFMPIIGWAAGIKFDPVAAFGCYKHRRLSRRFELCNDTHTNSVSVTHHRYYRLHHIDARILFGKENRQGLNGKTRLIRRTYPYRNRH